MRRISAAITGDKCVALVALKGDHQLTIC
jgi:hypothetical protein